MPCLLVIEDEVVLARNLVKLFTRLGWEARSAGDLAEGRTLCSAFPVDVVLVDLRLPDGSGLELLEWLLASDPSLPVILMTAHGSVADAVRAMQIGARDYVQKPFELDEIQLKVEMALHSARQKREISYYREKRAAAGAILGESVAARRLRALVDRIGQRTGPPAAPAPTVLLLGETGSGKGHVARALHGAGGRREGPFIEVNCTTLPDNLVETELFGHEKGAFTDAKAAHPGLFETAEGGAIFLDEIGHVSTALQAKFLKVIDEKIVRRIGGSAARRVDVQVLAATNRDLDAAVRLGEFREDLFQRLSVATIRIPPLREREDDAVLLGRRFLEETCRRYGVPPLTLSPQAEAEIVRYPWPGNIRELANAMERVVLFVERGPVRAEDLGLPPARSAARIGVVPTGEVQIDFPDGGLSLEAVERSLIEQALAKASGNRSGAARLLGISRDTLRYRMEKFGLDEAIAAAERKPGSDV